MERVVGRVSLARPETETRRGLGEGPFQADRGGSLPDQTVEPGQPPGK